MVEEGNKLVTLDGLKAVYDSIKIRIPEAPTDNGVYALQCTVVNGEPTYSWSVKDE